MKPLNEAIADMLDAVIADATIMRDALRADKVGLIKYPVARKRQFATIGHFFSNHQGYAKVCLDHGGEWKAFNFFKPR
jgi:hypothetical protein